MLISFSFQSSGPQSQAQIYGNDSEHVNYFRYGEAQLLHQGPNGQYPFVVGQVAERVQGLAEVCEVRSIMALIVTQGDCQ